MRAGCFDTLTGTSRPEPPGGCVTAFGLEEEAAILDDTRPLLADTVDSAVDRDRYGLSLLVNHRVNKRIRVYWNSHWWQEETRGDLIRDREVDNFRTTLGFRYDFEPMHF